MAEEGAHSKVKDPSIDLPLCSPNFVEVICKSSGKARRFAAGTEAGFALNLINRKIDGGFPLALHIEAVKEGEEPISFGPNSVLVDYGHGWKLQTVTETREFEGILRNMESYGTTKKRVSYVEMSDASGRGKRRAEDASVPVNRVCGRRVTTSSRREDTQHAHDTPPQVATDDRVETPIAPRIHIPMILTGPSPISRDDMDVKAEVGRMGQSLSHSGGSQALFHSGDSSASGMAGSGRMTRRGKDSLTSDVFKSRHHSYHREASELVDDDLDERFEPEEDMGRGEAQKGGRARGGVGGCGRGRGRGRGEGGCGSGDGDGDGDSDGDDDSWRLMDSHPGGPINPEVLSGFLGHIAATIWHNEERDVLGCHGSVDRLSSWVITDSPTTEFIARSGLGHLKECMFQHLNMPLISAFVERWHPETNSFHLPFGEMTLTLHDVHYILQIPVAGKPLIADTKLYAIKGALSTILRMPMCQIEGEVKSSGIKFLTVQDRLSPPDVNAESKAVGYLFWLMGATLFMDKTSNRINVHTIMYLMTIANVPKYAWGAATLSYLYRQLGIASRAGCKQMAGCLTLLQAWIYEYFPDFRPSRRPTWTPESPCALRWAPGFMKKNNPEASLEYRIALDRMTVDMVTWTPFGRTPATKVPITLFSGIIHCRTITEPYMPDRCLRQFGYVQTIPIPVYLPTKVYRGRKPHKYICKHDQMLRNFPGWQQHVVHPKTIGSKVATIPTEAIKGYLTWFRERSHYQVMPSRDDYDDDIDADDDP